MDTTGPTQLRILAGSTIKLDDATKLAGFIPLLVAAVALTYEVGYFYGFDENLFSMFSITDHILFTIESAPVALIGIPLSALMLFLFMTAAAWLAKNGFAIDINAVASIGLFLAGISLILLKLSISADDMIILIGIYLIVLGIAFNSRLQHAAPFVMLPLAFGFCLSVAFFLGVHISRDRLLNEWPTPGNLKHSIVLKDQVSKDPLTGRVITSGEKGVMFFDGVAKKLVFARWDNVISISSSSPPKH